MPSGRFSGTYAAPASSASVRPLSGEPLTEYLPFSSSMSSGAASSRCAASRLAFSATLIADRAGAGVAVDDVDLVGRGADPVGDDLRERRVEALAVRRRAAVGGHRARR